MKHSCLNDNLNIKELLEGFSESKTNSKIEILSYIQSSKKPVAAQEIIEALPKTDESTIFRNLKKFLIKGILQEIDLGEGFRRFELTPSNHHHHHIICSECGKIDAIHNCNIRVLEKQLKDLGYQHIKHKIEFSGLCNSCH